ncbi:hypothetical protein Acor_13990 [Acrocarpospora corrugata]|uniref:CARDB domain-containing protein n=1 Tax=Acrocarpospora corrugata TaxID=35763 RepID=A0A5M3VRM3_9ACTN|nr:cutinase family protein [Acrocarpospora corrugata]GER99335.1 hypothetical protein Acor_13990 [Acrocarpospora corrugata]
MKSHAVRGVQRIAPAIRLAVCTALTVALAVPAIPALAAAAPPDCPTVHVFAARGSGESAGMGKAVKTTYDKFRTLMKRKKVTVDYEALRYPAVPIWDPTMPASVALGAAELVIRVEQQAAACPEQEFVLAGYSQGAWVIHSALPLLKDRNAGRISALLLYADPLFHLKDKFAYPKGAGGSEDTRKYKGLLNRLYDLKTARLPSWVAPARTYCREGDVICSRSTGKAADCAKDLFDPKQIWSVRNLGDLEKIWKNCPYFKHTNYHDFAAADAAWLAGLFDEDSGVTYDEKIRVTPQKGVPGSWVTVTGRGWREHGQRGMRVPIGLNPSAHTLVQATPDDNGRFKVAMRIPASADTGPTTVWALLGNGSSVRTPFTVTEKPAPPKPKKPDLAPSQPYDLRRDPICAGKSPTFRVDIANKGGAASGFFGIRWIVDGDITFDGGHHSIAAGATDTHDHIWRDITPGRHSLTFTADFGKLIGESNEDNNTRTVEFTVRACGDGSGGEPAPGVPTAPSNAHFDPHTGVLMWNDNSSNEQGFRVYQNTTLRATLPEDTTQWGGGAILQCTDTIRITAYNAAGESAASSTGVPCR